MEKPDLPSGFANDVLNSLTAHIAVLDAGGRIVSVNEAWRRFARENGGECGTFYVGTSYLAVCEKTIRVGGDENLAAMLAGILAVLRGERDRFSFEYPCNSPIEERWFIARVTRYRREGAGSVIVSHEDITARRRAEEELRRAKEALEVANRELERALAREKLAARTDYLTGVYNRRHFFDLAAQGIDTGKGAAKVTISAGIADTLADDALDSLIRRADQALYEAKQAGRNRTVAFRPSNQASK